MKQEKRKGKNKFLNHSPTDSTVLQLIHGLHNILLSHSHIANILLKFQLLLLLFDHYQFVQLFSIYFALKSCKDVVAYSRCLGVKAGFRTLSLQGHIERHPRTPNTQFRVTNKPSVHGFGLGKGDGAPGQNRDLEIKPTTCFPCGNIYPQSRYLIANIKKPVQTERRLKVISQQLYFLSSADK